jgi:hypothetical protein
VKAFGAGKIVLPDPSTKARGLRYAPSFCLGGAPETNPKPYNAGTLAKFLGMSDCEWKVSAALDTIACDHHHHQQKGIKQMFWKSKPQPAAELNAWQLVERFKNEVSTAVDSAMEGRARDFPLQRAISRALRDAAQFIDVQMAMTQPIA